MPQTDGAAFPRTTGNRDCFERKPVSWLPRRPEEQGAGGFDLKMQTTRVRVITTLMTLAVMGLIFCFSMQPAAESDATSGWLSARIADLIRPEWRSYDTEQQRIFYNEIQHVVRKCAHFSEFALLGFCLRLCLESWLRKRKGLTRLAWAGGTAYAALDELHQVLVDGRSGQWPDVLIDSAGVLFGMLVLLGCLRLIEKRKGKASGTDKPETEGKKRGRR